MTQDSKGINIEYHNYVANVSGDVAIMHKNYLIDKLLSLTRRSIEQPSYCYTWKLIVAGEKPVVDQLIMTLSPYEDVDSTVNIYSKVSSTIDALVRLKLDGKIVYCDSEVDKQQSSEKQSIIHIASDDRIQDFSHKLESMKEPRIITIYIPYMFRIYMRPQSGISGVSCEQTAVNHMDGYMTVESCLDADVVIAAPYLTDAFAPLGGNMYSYTKNNETKTYILTDIFFNNTLNVAHKMNDYFSNIEELHVMIDKEIAGDKELAQEFNAYYNKFMSEFNAKPKIDIEVESIDLEIPEDIAE